MRTMMYLGWEPETEEERVFQLNYQQDKEGLEENKEVVLKVIREQLASPEDRRGEFAAYVTVGLV
ncbi:hypothetical protein P0Y35_17775 [Kiritimatiellaeota bacterium B1221]|nr:hypothetical protein [Kiritimatiellaeota bacterium B1221]